MPSATSADHALPTECEEIIEAQRKFETWYAEFLLRYKDCEDHCQPEYIMLIGLDGALSQLDEVSKDNGCEV